MWTTVYISTGQENTFRIKKQLTEEGYILRTKLLAKENGNDLFEILVPEFEAEEVQNFMIELGIL